MSRFFSLVNRLKCLAHRSRVEGGYSVTRNQVAVGLRIEWQIRTSSCRT
jgi:hypothetical protein